MGDDGEDVGQTLLFSGKIDIAGEEFDIGLVGKKGAKNKTYTARISESSKTKPKKESGRVEQVAPKDEDRGCDQG